MRTIQVKYDEIYAGTKRLRNHISNNITSRANTEYRQLQRELRRVDGATNANLQDALDINRQKTFDAAKTLDKLLRFIDSAARQIERSEQQMARTMITGRQSRR